MSESIKKQGAGEERVSKVVTDALETFEAEGTRGGEASREEKASRGESVRRFSRDEFFEATGIDGKKLAEARKAEAQTDPVTEQLDRKMDEVAELAEELSELEPTKFVLREKTPEGRARENEDRMARKLAVALVFDDTKRLTASDYELGDLEDRAFGAAKETGNAIEVIGEIMRPVDKKELGTVYDELSENEAATERLYNLTRGWKEKDDPDKTFSLEEQREIGVGAIREMVENYPTGLQYLREVEREVARRREEEPEGLLEWEDSAMKLGEAIYGKQFDYAKVYEQKIMRREPEALGTPAEEAEERIGAPAGESEERLGAPAGGVAEEAPEPAERTSGEAEPSVEQMGVGSFKRGERRRGYFEETPELGVGSFKRGERRVKYRDLRAPARGAEERIGAPAGESEERLGASAGEGLRDREERLGAPAGGQFNIPPMPVFERVRSTSPDKEQAEEDTRAVRKSLWQMEREKREISQGAEKREENRRNEEEQEALAKKTAEQEKAEVLEARAQAREKFKIEKAPLKKNPREVFKEFKKRFLVRRALKGGGRLVDIPETGEVSTREFTLGDFEKMGLVPEVVVKMRENGTAKAECFSRPFRTTRSDAGVAVLRWRTGEMSTPTVDASDGKTKNMIMFPEVYYKTDVESGEKWKKVEGVAQTAMLGSGTVDYRLMEKRPSLYLGEVSEGLNAALDEVISGEDKAELLDIDRASGDLVVASATQALTSVKRDLTKRGGVERLEPFEE